MFHIGPSEIILILIVALIVLGPKRLPLAAQQLGQFYKKIRLTWQSLQNELTRTPAEKKDSPHDQQL